MVKRCSILFAIGGLVAAQLFITVGSVSAAAPEYFTATLSGASEVPAVTTTATGSATIYVDGSGAFIAYDVTYQGLSGPAVAAHIHLGATGANGGIILPLKVGPSPMVGILTAADLTPSGAVATFAGAIDAMRAGNTYVNVHTGANPGGELRGQLGAPAVSPRFTIAADQPFAVPQGHNWGFNDFFPRMATIAQGDLFVFANEGFHTFTLLPAAMSSAADIATSGIANRDRDDTKPNPNGTTHAGFNVAAISPITPTPGCGSLAGPCTFDGSSILSSGLSFSGQSEPFAVKVTAPAATYTFHCRIHPWMTGTLTVVAPGSPGTTTPASASDAASAQVAASVAAGFAVEAANAHAGIHHNANGTTTWTLRAGASSSDGRVAILEFLPHAINVRRGDTVVWRPTDRNEVHTVTFPTELHTDTVPLCEAPGGIDKPAVPIVNPPSSPLDFGCNGHPPDEVEFGGGNGVRTLASPRTVSDSGILAYRTFAAAFGISGAVLPSWSVHVASTASRSTYHYVCQVHQGMEATLKVVK